MKKLLTLVLLFSTLAAISQPTFEKKKLEKVCDDFMIQLSTGNIKVAIDMLRPYTPIKAEALDTLTSTVTRNFQRLAPAYGKLLSWEFITDKKIKEVLSMRLYILKFENTFLTVDFLLYNNGTTWVITRFNYKDEVNNLMF